jgi:hypothetical protein
MGIVWFISGIILGTLAVTIYVTFKKISEWEENWEEMHD